jgi:hypothetical protein
MRSPLIGHSNMSVLPKQYTRIHPATEEPPSRAWEIIPNDDDSTTNMAFVTRVIYVGGESGDIKLKTLGDDIIIIPNMASQNFFPIQAIHVYATGTTATNLIGLA